MAGLGYACAVLLAAVLVRAGAAKLARPVATAASFRALGVPAAGATARAVPGVELAVATALIAVPRAGAALALVLLLAFSAVLARAVRSGVATPCNCFGTARAEPVSWLDVVRNGLLAVAAVAAATSPAPQVPGAGAVVVAVAAFAAGSGVLVAMRGRSAA
jgi:uncharacterized membrane protein YphA (DoxX/SURF4 family)